MYAALTAFVSSEAGQGLGSGLWHGYQEYAPMPTNATYAQTIGWYPDAGSRCIAGLGIKYSQTSGGPSKDKPISLYFTPAGQVSGVGTVAFGKFSGAVVDQGYWRSTTVAGEADAWRVDVGLRSPQAACSSHTMSELLLGDRAVINPGSVARALPLIQSGAIAENFETGSCIASMGTHSFYDLVGENGSMTWKAPNLMPIVPMYNQNAGWALNAIFFTSPFLQQSSALLPPPIIQRHQWDPIALPNLAMCANWCNEDCGWTETHQWSTMHIYFSDPLNIECQGEQGLHLSFCENAGPDAMSGVVGGVVGLTILGLCAAAYVCYRKEMHLPYATPAKDMH